MVAFLFFYLPFAGNSILLNVIDTNYKLHLVDCISVGGYS